MDVDSLDRQILEHKERDPDASLRAIGEAVELNASTVMRRLERLAEGGIETLAQLDEAEARSKAAALAPPAEKKARGTDRFRIVSEWGTGETFLQKGLFLDQVLTRSGFQALGLPLRDMLMDRAVVPLGDGPETVPLAFEEYVQQLLAQLPTADDRAAALFDLIDGRLDFYARRLHNAPEARYPTLWRQPLRAAIDPTKLTPGPLVYALLRGSEASRDIAHEWLKQEHVLPDLEQLQELHAAFSDTRLDASYDTAGVRRTVLEKLAQHDMSPLAFQLLTRIMLDDPERSIRDRAAAVLLGKLVA